MAVNPNQRKPNQRNPNQRKPRNRKRGSGDRKRSEFDSRAISIRRVAKVRAGAKRLRFSALVVAGDRKGRVGVALARAQDARSAIQKATKYATDHLARIDLIGDTIPHEVDMKYKAAKLTIRPAGPGTGVIASNAVRAVMELAGVRNVLTKQLGSRDPIANAYCAYEALKSLDKKRIMERKNAQLKSKLAKKKDAASKPKAKK